MGEMEKYLQKIRNWKNKMAEFQTDEVIDDFPSLKDSVNNLFEKLDEEMNVYSQTWRTPCNGVGQYDCRWSWHIYFID